LKCDCTNQAIRSCGTRASYEARKCRNEFIDKCFKKRCENNLIDNIRNSKTKVDDGGEAVEESMREIARKRCGEGKENRVCRKRIIKKLLEKEKSFRIAALKACNCKTKAKKECKELKKGNKCIRKRTKRCKKKMHEDSM